MDADGDGYSVADGDCNDDDPTISPGADELCATFGIDDDCDGSVDEGSASDAITWYLDLDGDLYGDTDAMLSACARPEGYVGIPGDCEAMDPDSYPGATEYCDGIDNDCDSETDEDDAADATTWFRDTDGDGFGDPDETAESCGALDLVMDASDCDDTDPSVSPIGVEMCDGIDNNCDGAVDEAAAIDATALHIDSDGDGYGDPDSTEVSCGADYLTTDSTDCDDTDAAVSPAGVEMCDGMDNDCDGATDEADASDAVVWYADTDGDGYGDPDSPATSCGGDGLTADASDCDDGNPAVNPVATEMCDGIDNNCDGETDGPDSADTMTFYADADGDGYGDPGSTTEMCSVDLGWTYDASDCDDGAGDIHPGVIDEECNGIDEDCDGSDECACSDASDGDLIVTSGDTVILDAGPWSFGELTVSSGATLIFEGEDTVVINASEVNIQGTIDVSGEDGSHSGGGYLPHGGDAGPGGGGGGGGGDCGNGPGVGGFPGGASPGGGSTGGGTGAVAIGVGAAPAYGGGYGPGGGGGGGGSSTTGGSGESGGSGGGSYSDASLSLFTGGGGGAGGGANGGGGGGGGGAISIHAGTINLTGSIDATGGEGGVKLSGSCTSGAGGGGAGGMVWLAAESLVIDGSGTISATGGDGGPETPATNQYGGDGADGRVLLNGTLLELSGSVSPTPATMSTGPECGD